MRSPTGPNCATFARPGITVLLLDAFSAQPITSQALVVARDGLYTDSVAATVPGRPYLLAVERPGTYTVNVTALGYAPWSLTPVIVSHDACHVVTMPLAAYLAPLP